MARYNYIVSGVPPEIWVGHDGNFESLLDGDKPTDYNAFTSLAKAKEDQVNCLLKSGYDCTIYKFEAKAPYKYLGEVK